MVSSGYVANARVESLPIKYKVFNVTTAENIQVSRIMALSSVTLTRTIRSPMDKFEPEHRRN